MREVFQYHGWEITDRVQRFVTNFSESLFVRLTDYDELRKLADAHATDALCARGERDALVKTLKQICEPRPEGASDIELVLAMRIIAQAALKRHSPVSGKDAGDGDND